MQDSSRGEYWVFGIAEAISWTLEAHGAHEFPLVSLPGWYVMTPLGYAFRAKGVRQNEAQATDPGSRLITISRFFVRGPNGSLKEGQTAGVSGSVEGLLKRLRWTSRQATVPRRVISWHIEKTPSEDVGIPDTGELDRTAIRDYLGKALVTAQHLEDACALPDDFVVPVHDEILLDAIEAFARWDYRKTILYSAIAVETLMASYLEEKYRALLEAPSSTSHRVVEVLTNGGGRIRKDPIYEQLCHGDSFRLLLHERPLYLLGRSVLSESPDLFRDATALYSTRNKIVHQGTPPATEHLLPLTATGAATAISTAASLFRWCGDSRAYSVSGDFVVASDPNRRYPGFTNHDYK